jgi:oxalate decarboxylase
MRRSSILSKNFDVSATLFERMLDPREIYIFKAPVPGPLGPDKHMGAEPVPQTFRTPWRGRD